MLDVCGSGNKLERLALGNQTGIKQIKRVKNALYSLRQTVARSFYVVILIEGSNYTFLTRTAFKPFIPISNSNETLSFSPISSVRLLT